MDKKSLIELAQQLKQVSDSSASEYSAKAESMVSKMNTTMSERKDILELIGENNQEMMHDNHENHARFMASIFNHYNPKEFVDTILWVFRAYRSHGFTTNYWAAQLNLWIHIIIEALSVEGLQEIRPYYEWMQVNIPIFVKLSDEKLESEISRH
jgi:hypothetical protein